MLKLNKEYHDNGLKIIKEIIDKLQKNELDSLVPVLPLLFQWKGKPYTLTDYFPFEELFKTTLPRRFVLKTGRQVSKSTSLAARSVIQSITIPYFSTLCVTPLFQQIRRFSAMYVQPFIAHSPFKHLWTSTKTENNVFQKSFLNQSQIIFSFCGLSVDRIRGVSANQCCFDEVQDIDYNHIPVVLETMGGQKIRLEMYAGTSKTLDNTLEGLWERSSQAEWCIPCLNCKHLNVPRMGEDLEKMIGPARPDISEQNPGVICSKCSRPLLPRTGMWVHKFPERKLRFAGYHVPQIIMPVHYASPERWSELLSKQSGTSGYTAAKFYNEVLGEAYDVGTKLVNKTDLQKVAVLPWQATPQELTTIAERTRNDYDLIVMGVDWGGGGEDEVSYTTCAVAGRRLNGSIDIIYGERLLTPHDQLAEARRIMDIYRAFNCAFFAHDFNSAGAVRETIMIQAGVPEDRVVPIFYVWVRGKNIMQYKPAHHDQFRGYWLLDKARSLVNLCQSIKLGHIRFFSYDFFENTSGLLHDFLALVEHKIPTARGPDLYTIRRNPNLSDDFAHSVNFACCAIWHYTQSWPDLAQLARLSGLLDAHSEFQNQDLHSIYSDSETRFFH
jgi:hypothetical protein